MRISTFDINPQAPDYSNLKSIAALLGLARGNKSLQRFLEGFELSYATVAYEPETVY